ncbi:MAG: MotA/TolQ/ExbB proton channel family protein, partial [Kiritimatiellae bacterium]|nr:MotA/TolQ/ExbB proton channel family protein [Kiritimatiellia bacterium]
KESKRFLSAYRAEAHPVALFLKQRPFAMTPLYLVYDRACQALGGELNSPQDSRSELFNYRDDPQENRITPTQLEIVRNLIERNVADQALLLEDHMGFLATSVSVAPFLGLLGTVWGVMDAFGGMAITGAATLSAVAPGIAGALLTTIIGLLVALPSSIGYNILTNKIRRITVDMDNFAQELYADIQRTFVVE